MRIPKPSFSNHPGNYVLALAVGLLAFFAASLANAELSRRYDFVQLPGESMTTLHNRVASHCNAMRYEWQNMGYSGWSESYSGGNCSTSSIRDGDGPNYDAYRTWTLRKSMSDQASCDAVAGSTWLSGSLKCEVRPGIQWYEHATGNCPAGSEDDGTGKCTYPPQDCNELKADEDPSGTIWESDKYFNYGCNHGCYIESDSAMYSQTDSAWLVNGHYTGDECPGGFNMTSGFFADYKDVLPEDQEWQNCYNSDGTYLGQVGADMECPSYVNCWDDERIAIIAVAPDPQSCAQGTPDSMRDAEAATNTTTTSTTTNPDGSTETTTETSNEQTAADGSTGKSSSKSVTTCDSNGVCTTSETTNETGVVCEGDGCEEGTPGIEGYDSCSAEFVCKGDVLWCARAEVEHEQSCALTQDSLDNWTASQDFGDNYEAGEDGYGQLGQLSQGGNWAVDTLLEVNSWLGDDGTTAACPAPIEKGWIVVDVAPWCEYMGMVRAPLILFNAFAILMFFRRSLLGG